MDLNVIKKLIRIVEKSEITEFSFSEGDTKIKISKNNSNVQNVFSYPQQTLQPQAVNTVNKGETSGGGDKKEEAESSLENLHEVCSPIVGTFYRAPAPDADPYVQVGDTVQPGTVLCIVEAMKLMNEIESDVQGTIVKILVDNATPVEYNQPLFLIKVD